MTESESESMAKSNNRYSQGRILYLWPFPCKYFVFHCKWASCVFLVVSRQVRFRCTAAVSEH